MPCGLGETIKIGAASGAKPAAIILAHSLRFVVIVALTAFGFRIVSGHAVGALVITAPVPVTLLKAAVMLASAKVGSLLGFRPHFPAPTFPCPLAGSAVLHLAVSPKACLRRL